MALIQPRQALRAWLARPAPSSSSPAPPVRAFHGFTPRDGRVLVSLWAPDANLNASEWLSGVNRQRRDWLRFCKRWAHTRTSSGSKGGRGTGFQSETHDDRDWLSRSEKDRLSRLIGLRRDISHSYSVLDTILYHLAVGKTLGQTGSNAIQYLNENDEGFRVLPLFGTIPAQKGIKEILENDLQIDFSKLLHGEHYFQLYRPIPKGAQVHSIIQLADIVNKGKDAVFIFDVATRDDQENFLMYNQFCYFVKGAGGIGDKTRSDTAVPIINNYFQDQHPTFEHHHTTSADQQAALFRLTGDTNPYLIDPNLAQKFGYKHPPLHGVCSLGIVANILQEQFQIPDDKFKGIKVRFSAPLFPGDTIQIWAWRMHKNVIFFNTMSMESGDMVHTGGYLTTY